MPKKPYYITTAIAYTSGKPHIGNTYEVVLADSIARYKRYVGYDVRFQTGTDEHGQKIEIKAFENLSTPKEFVDETSHHANPSSRKHSLWTANARTVAVRYSRQRKKHTSSSSANTLTA